MIKRAILAVTLAATFGVGGVASAAPPVHESFHEEFADTDDNFCDAGLSVDVAVTVDGRALIRTVGKNSLVYFAQHVTVENIFTNPDTGVSIRSVDRVVSKDLHVTDNGDGTLTVVVLATGYATLFGPDGTAIARNPGQIRFQLLVDHGGTPTDPSDDVELAFELIKESTGRTDDFCGPALDALT